MAPSCEAFFNVLVDWNRFCWYAGIVAYNKISKTKKSAVLTLGTLGLTTIEIEKRTGVSRASVWRWLHEAEIPMRGRGDHVYLTQHGTKNKREKKVRRTDFFREIDSEEKAYFLGLIHADGWAGTYEIVLALGKEDGYLVRRACVAMESCNKVSQRQGGMIGVSLGSKELADDVKRHGVLVEPDRFLRDESVPLTLRRHFIRGIFDGDGSVGIPLDHAGRPANSRLTWSLAGGKQVLETIARWLYEESITDDTKEANRNDRRTATHKINIGQQHELRRLRDYLYGRASPDLLMERKRRIFFSMPDDWGLVARRPCRPFMTRAVEVWRLRDDGLTMPQIAKRIGCGNGTVHRILHKPRPASSPSKTS